MADEWTFDVIVDPCVPPGKVYIVPQGLAVPVETFCRCGRLPEPDYQPRATVTISLPDAEDPT